MCARLLFDGYQGGVSDEYISLWLVRVSLIVTRPCSGNRKHTQPDHGRSSEANGMVERFHRRLKAAFRSQSRLGSPANFGHIPQFTSEICRLKRTDNTEPIVLFQPVLTSVLLFFIIIILPPSRHAFDDEGRKEGRRPTGDQNISNDSTMIMAGHCY